MRLLKLVDNCKGAGIEPILLTQPTVFGGGFDEATGIDLENIRLDDKTNGSLFRQTVNLYNQQTKDVGTETNSMVIDLSSLMPKSSLYFYDSIHYTNEGAAKISEILDDQLTQPLEENYPLFKLQGGSK
jgi:hypothetical protein